MEKKNKGMSLVEIIIVVAIMAVMAGGVAIGLSVIFDKPADGCAKKIQAVLQNARTTSMGRFGDVIVLDKDASGNIVIRETIHDKNGTASAKPVQIVGDSKVNVTCKNGSGATMALPVTIEFDRTNGGLKGGAAGCAEITVSAGSRTRYVKISYVTGKISYE